jgi:hypothetical protein
MANPIRANSLVIEPVIEILPSTLDPSSEPPPGMLTEDERRQWTQRALDRAGLGTLSVDGCWALARDVVELPGACEVIVEATLRERSVDTGPGDAKSDEDEHDDAWVDHVLACGIAMRVEGLVRAWPGCCADWGALRELRQALDATTSDERSIWIGHDGGAVSICAASPDTLTLRTWHEERGEPEEWLVARALMRREVEAAWDVIDRFEAVARPILDTRLSARTVRSRERS